MRLGSAYLTANRFIAYPFEDDATGLDYAGSGSYGVNPAIPAGAFVDAAFIVWDTVSKVYLYRIVKNNGSSSTLIFRDQDANTLGSFTITVPTVAKDDYTVVGLEDTPAPSDILNAGLIGRILVSKDFTDYMAAMPVGTVTFGTSLLFAQNAVEVRPARLLSIEAYNDIADVPTDDAMGPNALTGNVKLIAGYNMRIEEGTSEDNDVSVLTFTAEAGAGEGIVPCDEQTNDPRVPQQLHPDSNGNITIAGDGCYAVTPSPLTGEILLQGSCYPCCDCDDYADIGNELRGLLVRTGTLYSDLLAIHQGPLPGSPNLWGYEDAVAYWNGSGGSGSGSGGGGTACLGITAAVAGGADGSWQKAVFTLGLRNVCADILEIRWNIEDINSNTSAESLAWRTVDNVTTYDQAYTTNIGWQTITDTIPGITGVRYTWYLWKVPSFLAYQIRISVQYRKWGVPGDPWMNTDPASILLTIDT